jgi:hypothetical protein
MHLFTKTGVRISANMRYKSQPWRTPKYMHTHIISANYGFLRTSMNIGYVGKFNHYHFDFLLPGMICGPSKTILEQAMKLRRL